MPLFNFELLPIEEIEPWGKAENPNLHWFGLSDGRYWLTIDGHDLFRYQQDAPDVAEYVEYQVVRLWEDVLEILPAVLDPIPPDLQALVETPERERAWLNAADSWLDRQPDDPEMDGWDIYHRATGWWANRQLGTTYLTNAPTLHIWRAGDRIFIRWNGARDSAKPVVAWRWAVEHAEGSLSLDEFERELVRLDTAFIGAMAQRVTAIVAAPPAGIAIDLDALRQEQRDRSQEMARVRRLKSSSPPWDEIRKAIAAVA